MCKFQQKDIHQLENKMFNKLILTDHSKTTIIIRLIVGAVFLSEGIQKFLFPAIRGAGRFEKNRTAFARVFRKFCRHI